MEKQLPDEGLAMHTQRLLRGWREEREQRVSSLIISSGVALDDYLAALTVRTRAAALACSGDTYPFSALASSALAYILSHQRPFTRWLESLISAGHTLADYYGAADFLAPTADHTLPPPAAHSCGTNRVPDGIRLTADLRTQYDQDKSD